MFYFDWTYLLIIPGLLLGLWAQAKVKGAYAEYREGSQLLEVQGDEGGNADDDALPIDKILWSGKAEGGRSDETQHGGAQASHHSAEYRVVFPTAIDLG